MVISIGILIKTCLIVVNQLWRMYFLQTGDIEKTSSG
jgi:hypothetical protein